MQLPLDARYEAKLVTDPEYRQRVMTDIELEVRGAFQLSLFNKIKHTYSKSLKCSNSQGRIQDLIRGGPQIVTGLKLPFWGLSFVEFLVLGPHFWWSGGGPGPPLDPPLTLKTQTQTYNPILFSFYAVMVVHSI